MAQVAEREAQMEHDLIATYDEYEFDFTPVTRAGDRAALLAPPPDHRNVATPWWQELWRRHAHITTPLRQRGLECDIEFGLSAYIVRVSLPDDSYLVISPPQESSSDRSPGSPEGWIATREHPDKQALFEVVYDSAPSADPGALQRTEARHGGSVQPLIEAIDYRLAQFGLLPHPVASAGDGSALRATPTLHAPEAPAIDWATDPRTAFNDHPAAWSSLAPAPAIRASRSTPPQSSPAASPAKVGAPSPATRR